MTERAAWSCPLRLRNAAADGREARCQVAPSLQAAVTLQDIFLLEDGSRAVSNAQLVAAASAIVQGSEGELSTLSG